MKGLPAFHEHIRLFKTLPDISEEKSAETPTAEAPLTPDFWNPEKLRRERAHLTHRIKTLYGFETLARLATDENQRRHASNKLRYLM